jgi:hypothetical protein
MFKKILILAVDIIFSDIPWKKKWSWFIFLLDLLMDEWIVQQQKEGK